MQQNQKEVDQTSEFSMLEGGIPERQRAFTPNQFSLLASPAEEAKATAPEPKKL